MTTLSNDFILLIQLVCHDVLTPRFVLAKMTTAKALALVDTDYKIMPRLFRYAVVMSCRTLSQGNGP